LARNSALCSQVEKLTELTYFKSYDTISNGYPKTLDLSKTKLITLGDLYSNFSTVIVPDTVTKISMDGFSGTVEFRKSNFSEEYNVEKLTLWDGWLWETIDCSNLSTSKEISSSGSVAGQTLNNKLIYMKNNLVSIKYNRRNNTKFYYNFETLKDLVKLRAMELYNGDLENVSYISNYTSLQRVYFKNCCISNQEFEELIENSSASSISVPNNDISTVPYSITTNNYLTELDLSGNLLQNYITYEYEGGNKTELLCDVLARIPNLTVVKLGGNTALTDFSGLTKVGFVQNGTNFTRTLGEN